MNMEFIQEYIIDGHHHPIIYFFMFVFFVVLLIYLRRQSRLTGKFKSLSKSYDSLFNGMKEGVALHEVILDDNGEVVDYIFLKVNKAFEEITGLKSKDLIDMNVKTVMPLTEDYWIEKYGNVAMNGEPYSFENYSQQLGKHFKVNVYSPERGQFITVFTDITEEIKIKEEIEKERALFKTTLYSLGDAVISSDINGNVEIMNVAAEVLTGFSVNEARGKKFSEIYRCYEDERDCIIRDVLKTGRTSDTESDILIKRKDGTDLSVEHRASPITDKNGQVMGAVVVFRDYSNQKEYLEKITYLSYHDQLTGLYNRRYYQEESERLDTARNLPITLIMIDVNGLKLTNDAFGHQMGDRLLMNVADVLKSVCRSDEIISRIGGDEIVILLPDTDSQKAQLIIDRINSEIKKVKLDNIVISVSIGQATKIKEETSMDELFVLAEENMYRKKLTETKSMRNQTIKVILKTLNESNEREKMHSERVSKLAGNIAAQMGISEQKINEIETAALMHDIGKITINNNLLDKKGPLNDAEFAEVRKHTESGYHILKSVDEYSEMAECVLSHHERWDGKGYPRGLKGKEIPLFARIIAVADAYEAMTAIRPYRKTVTKEMALKELKRCSGTQFDPEIIEVCMTDSWTRE